MKLNRISNLSKNDGRGILIQRKKGKEKMLLEEII